MSINNNSTAHFLSEKAQIAFQNIQRDGHESTLPDDLTDHEKCFLIGELYVRQSRYNEIESAIPKSASEWWRRLALCTGFLFTSPVKALEEIEYLLQNCQNEMLIHRLLLWKMHLLLLIGREEEGKALRHTVENNPPIDYYWPVERLTLLAVSFFSTSESKKAIELHIQCIDLCQIHPEQFFLAFGSAAGMRVALKICDAQAFDLLSRTLIQTLGKQEDDRYLLRSHSYRAMVLTQLGEADLAQRYWEEGDKILSRVDVGSETVERGQYLIFRCLAASLFGEEDTLEKFVNLAEKELLGADVYAIHMAELNVCKILSPIANPHLRSKKVAESFHALNRAIQLLDEYIAKSDLPSIVLHYKEAREFCLGLLNGHETRTSDGQYDKWRTLTVSVIDSFQNSAEFAKQIGYFRQIPQFVEALESENLDEKGIFKALTSVMPFSPRMENGEYILTSDIDRKDALSQHTSLLTFANTLNTLAKEAKHNARSQAIADTVQTVIHEVKRPFNLLNMSLEAAAQCKDPARVQTMLANTVPLVKDASQRVDVLMKEILTTENPGEIIKKYVEVDDLIIDAINRVEKSRGHPLRIKKRGTSRLQVKCDSVKIGRAIENLIENAADASPGKEIEIYTDSYPIDSQPYLKIVVNNDAYVPKENLVKVFDKSYTSGKVNGTGLGLSIVKGIILAHGGHVDFKSDRKNGTDVSFLIPN